MRIAHLSDPHLTRGPLAGQSAAGLADALGRLLSIEPRPDCVVITGDLADSGHPDEYTLLRTILRRCPVPMHLLAGNHDDPAALIAKFGDTPFLGNGVSSTYLQSALRMHDAGAPGYVAEPTGFLLHVLDGTSCVTHSVAVSHAAVVRAF